MIATSGVVAPICHSLCFLTPDIPLTMTMDAINSEFDIQSQIHLKVEKYPSPLSYWKWKWKGKIHLEVARWKWMSAFVVFFPLITRFFAAISFLHSLLLYVTAKLAIM